MKTVCQHTHTRDNLNRLITIKEIKSIINLLKQEALGPDEFTGEFYQTLK